MLHFIPIPMPPSVEEDDAMVLGVLHTAEGEDEFNAEIAMIRAGEAAAARGTAPRH